MSPPAETAGGAVQPAAGGVFAAGDLISAASRGCRRGQRGGQGEGARHL